MVLAARARDSETMAMMHEDLLASAEYRALSRRPAADSRSNTATAPPIPSPTRSPERTGIPSPRLPMRLA
eukprot:4843611-Pleurochrysis_carterae.AAC.2